MKERSLKKEVWELKRIKRMIRNNFNKRILVKLKFKKISNKMTLKSEHFESILS